MAFTENLRTTYFRLKSEGGLAEPATYEGGTVPVHLDSEYFESVAGVAGSNPVAMGIATDFADPIGKSLVVNSVTYTIRNKRAQDDGAMVLLDLEVA